MIQPLTIRRQGAIALVEVLVAMALMAFAAQGIGQLLSTSTYQGVKARVDQKLRGFINEKVDFYTLCPYTSLANGSVQDARFLAETTNIDGSANKRYPCTAAVTVADYNGGKKVDVQFSWSAPSPNFGEFMSSNAGPSSNNTVASSYTVPTIQRYP